MHCLFLLSTLLSVHFSTSKVSGDGDCNFISSDHFKWINSDGSLVLQTLLPGVPVDAPNDSTCCGKACNETWMPLLNSSNCHICLSDRSVVCEGSQDYTVPDPSTLPFTNLMLFKMSGVGLIALPPNCFNALHIDQLVIQNSNLTYISYTTFTGVKSIKAIHLINNTIDNINRAENLLNSIPDLSVIDLRNNGLRVLSSLKSANLINLNYFSLAGNPIHTFDAFFLQGSHLKVLDLQNITFKVRSSALKGSGLNLLPRTLNTIDLNGAVITVQDLKRMLKLLEGNNITTLNLGFLSTSEKIFNALSPVRKSLLNLSFQGTYMNDEFNGSGEWVQRIEQFVNLKELNLKQCSIESFNTGTVFSAFPSMEAISLAENSILYLDLQLFLSMDKLNFFDYSQNSLFGITSYNGSLSESMTGLNMSGVAFSIDFEYLITFFNSFPNLQNVSFCNAEIKFENINALQNSKNLKFLDLSGTILPITGLNEVNSNFFIESAYSSTLAGFNLARNNIKLPFNYLTEFSQMSSLRILDLSQNFISQLTENLFPSSLQKLNLSHNFISTWYTSVVSQNSELEALDLSSNQITYVTDAMVSDFCRLKLLDLDSNPLMCHKKVVSIVCANIMKTVHYTTILDWQLYQCYDEKINNYRLFSEPSDCKAYFKEESTSVTTITSTENTVWTTNPTTTSNGSRLHVWLWVFPSIGTVGIVFFIAILIYLKWWQIRCYLHRFLSLRRARLLRKNGDSLVKSETHYDVFVSYSDVDRSWVLDHLIQNLEPDGDISLCFHERDFQVGLGILENIIECMDRSNSLLLIVSSAFVRSKWCQFEMHLAQYRLIETFRDQLVLVLLEDIPRKSRPQTLHHLMMTKTYLFWPQDPKKEARELFWKRLKRAVKPNN